MCGRFTQRYTWSEVLQFLRVFGSPRNLQPHYNIAPTMNVDAIRLDKDGKRELVPMRWGLIPAWWAKSLKEIPATFNARAEYVADKPMFRDAFKGQRCIIPASGFYEYRGRPYRVFTVNASAFPSGPLTIRVLVPLPYP